VKQRNQRTSFMMHLTVTTREHKRSDNLKYVSLYLVCIIILNFTFVAANRGETLLEGTDDLNLFDDDGRPTVEYEVSEIKANSYLDQFNLEEVEVTDIWGDRSGGTPQESTEVAKVVDLPFTFNFCGKDYEKLVIGINGYVAFSNAFYWGYSKQYPDESHADVEIGAFKTYLPILSSTSSEIVREHTVGYAKLSDTAFLINWQLSLKYPDDYTEVETFQDTFDANLILDSTEAGKTNFYITNSLVSANSTWVWPLTSDDDIIFSVGYQCDEDMGYSKKYTQLVNTEIYRAGDDPELTMFKFSGSSDVISGAGRLLQSSSFILVSFVGIIVCITM